MKTKSKKILLIVLSVILALLVVLISSYFILRYIGKKSIHDKDKNIKTDAVEIDDEDLVTYNNQKYRLNENIVSILIMGIDKKDITENLGYGKNGQADCIFLAAIDTEKKKFTVIPISRESMVDVDTYSTGGSYAGTAKQQLCLAYAYGKTGEESCKSVVSAVQRMFYQLNISSYIAIDLNGLSKLTDMIGGVQIKSIETFSKGGFSFEKDQTYRLSGKKAEIYIRSRDGDIDSNNRRMLRQKQFLSALITATGNKVVDDFSNLARYYNTMAPYVSTSIDISQATYLATECLTRDIGSRIEYKSIEGTMTQNEYNEFNINEDSLLSLIIDVFYEKAETKAKKK